MKNCVALLAASILLAVPAFAQRNEQQREEKHREREHGPNAPRANQGRIPAPPQHREVHAAPEQERREGGRVNSLPHVNNDHWYGHDRPNDKSYHVDHPFEHGRFEHFGPSYRYRVERFDPDRHVFWFPGAFPFKSLPGIGPLPRIGVGTAVKTTLFTKTRTTTAGICCTTCTRGSTST